MAQQVEKPAKRHVTLKDIGERCGVCKQVVSRALRGDKKVSKEKAEYIRAVAAEMGYDPDRHFAARRMSLRKHGRDVPNEVIAYFFSEHAISSDYMNALLWGVWMGTASLGYGMLLIDWRISIPAVCNREEVDGAVILALDTTATMEGLVRQLGEQSGFAQRPIVTFLSPVPGCPSVTIDDYEGARMAAGHLLDLGHTHMLHCFLPHFQLRHHVTDQRIAGYRQAFLDNNLNPDVHLHTLTGEEWSDYELPRMVARIIAYLHTHPEVTGILARNDHFAVQLIPALQQAGWRVPEDISVIGCDDTEPVLDAHGNNLLTTIHNPLREAGTAAAELTIRLAKHEPVATEHIVLQPSLVVRHSTATNKREVK